MMVVGLTGGMGSGKTLVGEIFSTWDIPVFNADAETKKLYDADPALRTKLIDLLGGEIYADGRLQRNVMAAKIFSDKRVLQAVNVVVHPVVTDYFMRYAARQHAPYVIMESAAAFENGIDKQMDKTITVNAPEALRIQRVTTRDSVSETIVRQRLQHQWTDEQRTAAADFVIINDGQTAVLPQALNIHEQMLNIIENKFINK
jgi:dephospho-CoA kinase